jgi:hypothetical protein
VNRVNQTTVLKGSGFGIFERAVRGRKAFVPDTADYFFYTVPGSNQ